MSQVTTFYMDVKLYASGVELTAKLIYPVKRFEFYVGGGAGYWWVTEGTFVALPLGGSYGEVYDSLLGYHAVAGASFDVLRWLYLGLEGKYVFLPNFLDGGEIPGWGLTLGIGFRFL
jgi:opacity protein-like surface antigen